MGLKGKISSVSSGPMPEKGKAVHHSSPAHCDPYETALDSNKVRGMQIKKKPLKQAVFFENPPFLIQVEDTVLLSQRNCKQKI
jgi:hypothetical protein